MLIKLYGVEPEDEKRYNPAECMTAEKLILILELLQWQRA
jgi:hypothetical protein